MDRKLRLDLNVLSVDSFAAEMPEMQLRGTVEGQAGDPFGPASHNTYERDCPTGRPCAF
jgi:hypothetical protein